MQQEKQYEKRIPKAIFIQHVEEACKKEGSQNLLGALDQHYNRYKLVESQLMRSSQNMQNKIPEIKRTIQMIRALSHQKQNTVDFMLSQGIYVKAKAKDNLQKVALWLGANTIVQLSFGEAQSLLSQNLNNALSSLQQINEELTYVRDQRTTSEVNIARIYNYSLLQKRQLQIKKQKEEEQKQ